MGEFAWPPGFLFSYEKLFGAKAKSKTDLDNESQGKDTTIDRTRRLFYVTCSRAMSSLGIVAYTGDPTAVQHHVVSQVGSRRKRQRSSVDLASLDPLKQWRALC